ncbi:uncharacterized protein LOC107369246 [Tetranychus urticae]|uniref:uncharacterized protein LOC107369246 n=1 Tax=Tetranychus urticae TaxID=32264 RepID=UPI00077BEA1D|nr:uncharacterized protein LOC107369246 [Tetranychus urticae]
MRFTIVLALCFIGAASASSLKKRSFLDDIQNNTQNAFHAFEQFGQNFNEKVQEAFKNLFDAFGNKNQTTEASVTVTKRSSNPFALFDDLGKGDLVAFAQDLLKVLADVAPGRRKRYAAEDLKDLLKAFVNKNQSTEASVIVNKRDSNPFALIDDLAQGNLFAFAHDLLKVLAEVAPGRRKRDAAEDFKSKLSNLATQSSESSDVFTVAKNKAQAAIEKLLTLHEQSKKSSQSSNAFTFAKFNVDDALWKLLSLIEQLKPQASQSSDAFNVAKNNANDALWKLISFFGQLQPQSPNAVTVGKRSLDPFVLFDDIQSGDIAKFSSDFLKVLAEAATLRGW